jgi:hypothetical protein
MSEINYEVDMGIIVLRKQKKQCVEIMIGEGDKIRMIQAVFIQSLSLLLLISSQMIE